MRDAHVNNSHRGRDSTVSTSRQKFLTPQAAKVARSVTSECTKVKKTLSVTASYWSPARFSALSLSSFLQVRVDIFGPYTVKDDVRKRSRGKSYGVLFTDLFSGAVHLETVSDYDANSFLNALLRFTSD